MSSLFHTLVVCGAGLTLLHCGGRSERQDADQSGGSGNGPSGGAGGASAAGSSGTGAGGLATGGVGTGGTIGIGGSITSAGGAGGMTGGAGGGVAVGGFAGAISSTQVVCAGFDPFCSGGEYRGEDVAVFQIQGPCAIDPTRPRSQEDCPSGEVFECALALLTPESPEAEPIDCRCRLPEPGLECDCPNYTDGCYQGVTAICEPGVNLCGCALTCILR